MRHGARVGVGARVGDGTRFCMQPRGLLLQRRRHIGQTAMVLAANPHNTLGALALKMKPGRGAWLACPRLRL